ncbi:MAG TPA: class I SAM-dependent DNA methyltransferase [Candidatus Paceibacterota bacterium]|nr:class I SAM-dependent DNA methyltransferase [Candidatus Paceibacterota bacterium]
MPEIQNIIKNIQNIMRKDPGVDGDAQRLSQLVWMLFLKIVDDKERELEYEDKNFKSPIPEDFRWRNWASDKEGKTGEELYSFVDTKLFPALRNLSTADATNPEMAQTIRNIFGGTYNYMRNGTLIRQVVNKINEINFNKKSDRHEFGDLYEKLLKDLQSAGNAGEFYTPRPLTKFVVEMVAPELGEKVLDPACGTGGFLVNVLEYVRGHNDLSAKQEKDLEKNIHGVELKPLPNLLATTNLILHDVEATDVITPGDMLSKNVEEYNRDEFVDVVVTNPPFGGVVADGIEHNFPRFQTKETADLFLVLIMKLLKDGGRAGIVLPDGTLFGEGVKTKIKKELLETCNLHTIVRLPQGVFNPYAGVNTNLVFFEKGTPTKEVWYYQLPLPEGLKQYTKNRGIQNSEFDPVCAWWGGEGRKGRKENVHAWKVPIEEIEKRNYNLDFKNPNGKETEEFRTSAEILKSIEEKEKEIGKVLKELL